MSAGRSAHAPATPTSISFDVFFSALREPDTAAPILSARCYAAALNIDLQTLADQAHVHYDTVAHAPQSVGVQRFLREAVRVIHAATDQSGDVHRALFWYRNAPLPAFDYQTAESLVSAGRAEDVLRYVASLEAGAAG
ncbi:antitoxin Xre/MbcA/ParS toxin-binding domain-containing protein [Burkholderia gladioli]|uniref:antitoxin Xre/MbcA/ParS toxin-binding domain-containing protein n=1 Tax=Burkholderia gladioli TaxID=28095 RepID=UPI00163F7732|nr:antitoxin Xre/MbcA/ParS toxin-binding domain-containing protein [Burkholderia gladioli]